MKSTKLVFSQVLSLGLVFTLMFGCLPDKGFALAGPEELLFQEIPVVYLAALSGESIEKASGIVSVVTAKDIKRVGARDIIDVLDMLPGVETTANRRWFRSARFRGLGSAEGSQVLFMVDGVPVNNILSGSGFFHFSDMSLDEVDRIEVIRGPGSALYGENALLGVINIVTKKPSGLAIASKGGSFHSRGGSLSYGRAMGEGHIGVTGNYFKTDGFKKTIEHDAGSFVGFPLGAAAQTPGPSRAYSERSQVGFSLASGGLTFNANYANQEKDSLMGVTSILTQNPKTTNRFHAHDAWVELKYSHRIGELVIEPSSQFTYTTAGLKWQLTPVGYFHPDGLKGSPNYTNNKVVGDIKIRYDGLKNHQVLAGVSYAYAHQYNIFGWQNFDPFTFGPSSVMLHANGEPNLSWNQNKSRETASAYAQDKVTLSESLSLTVGGRHDKYSDVGESFNPRAFLSWAVTPRVDAKVLYGTAFRVPNFLELYNINNPAELGDQDLKPEKIRTYEVGVYTKTDESGSLLGVNGFYNKVDNLIDLRLGGGPIPVYSNGAKQNFYGAELEYKANLSDRFTGGLSYAYVDGAQEGGERLRLVSHHKATAMMNVAVLRGLTWNASAFYHSAKDRPAGDARSAMKGYAVVNTTVGYEFMDGVEVSGSVFNLFDKDYFTSDPTLAQSDLPRNGREIRMKVAYQF